MFDRVNQDIRNLAQAAFGSQSKAAALISALTAAEMIGAADALAAAAPEQLSSGQVPARAIQKSTAPSLSETLADLGFEMPASVSAIKPDLAGAAQANQTSAFCSTVDYDSVVTAPLVPWPVPDGGSAVVATAFDPQDPSKSMGDVMVKLSIDVPFGQVAIDLLYDREDDGINDVVTRVLGPTCGTQRFDSAQPVTLSFNATPTIGNCGSSGTISEGCYHPSGSGSAPFNELAGQTRGGVFRIRVTDLSTDGHGANVKAVTWLLRVPALVDVPQQGAALAPLKTWPNPTRGGVHVNFSLPIDERVALEIFDLNGRSVRTLASGPWRAGRHELSWDGSDEAGRAVAPGIYYVNFFTQERHESKPVVMLDR